MPDMSQQGLKEARFRVLSAAGAWVLGVVHGTIEDGKDRIQAWWKQVVGGLRGFAGSDDAVLMGDINAVCAGEHGREGPRCMRDEWVQEVLEQEGISDAWTPASEGPWYTYTSPASGKKARLDRVLKVVDSVTVVDVSHAPIALADGHRAVCATVCTSSLWARSLPDGILTVDDSVRYKQKGGVSKSESLSKLGVEMEQLMQPHMHFQRPNCILNHN